MAKALDGKVALITGSTRGIGKAIALKLSQEGAKVGIVGKTSTPHATLPGTVDSVVAEIEAAGGAAIGCVLDVRDEQGAKEAIDAVIAKFGRLDMLVNNASALSLTKTLDTEMKRFDLMFGVNVRGTFLLSKLAIPHLQKSSNPHIINLSPPLNMNPRWFKDHVAYTMSKYGMSMCTLGMSEELRAMGIAVNSLWPKTTVATSAIEAHFPKEFMQKSRHPSIMSDAVFWIVTQSARECTGNFFLDETVMAKMGKTDLSAYAVDPTQTLMTDCFWIDIPLSS